MREGCRGQGRSGDVNSQRRDTGTLVSEARYATLAHFPHSTLQQALRCVFFLSVWGAGVMNVASNGAERLPEPHREAAGPARGALVIIGGAARHDNQAIWSEITQLAGGTGKRVAVFPCASSYPLRNGERAVKLLKKYGLDPFVVPLALSGIDGVDYREVVRNPEWIEQVRSAGGVFFIGGSQSRIRDALVDEQGENSPMLDAVWDVYRRGGVVAGTSAGAAIMSRVMFRDPGAILGNMIHGVRMGKELDHGLGFLDANWFVDQHCLVRGRFARALVAMRERDVAYGLGIDEDTAVVVERGERARVVGNRGAVVLDLSQSESDESQKQFNVRNARLTYLNHGDSIHLPTLAVTPNPTKQADRKIDPNSPDFRPVSGKKLFYMDVLANTTLVDVMSRVIEHHDGQAIGLAFDGAAAAEGSTAGFEFRFYRGQDSLGWETDAHGTTDATIQNIHLDIRPVTIQGPLYSPTASVPASSPSTPENRERVVAGGPTAK